MSTRNYILDSLTFICDFSRTDQHDAARSCFQDVSTKNLDYPEALWDAWLSFEHAHGSLTSLEEALARVERARSQVEARRMRVGEFSLRYSARVAQCKSAFVSQEAQKAYEAAQYAMEQHVPSAPVTSVPANVTQETTPPVSGDGMDVDVPTTSAQGKRKASEEPEVDGSASKKVRMGTILSYHSAVSPLIAAG